MRAEEEEGTMDRLANDQVEQERMEARVAALKERRKEVQEQRRARETQHSARQAQIEGEEEEEEDDDDDDDGFVDWRKRS